MLLEQLSSSRENQSWTGVLNTLLYPGYREWVWGSCESFADWIRHVYWMGKSKANTFSLCKVGGETGYTAQEDLKSINSYDIGEGRMKRVWFFRSCIPKPFWFYLLFHPWVTTFVPLFLGPIFWTPLARLRQGMCYFLPSCHPQVDRVLNKGTLV